MKLVSREEARARFRRVGKSIEAYAKELNVHPVIVRRVLAGSLKGERGDAHKVAVALGLKEGVIVADDMPVSEALKRCGGGR